MELVSCITTKTGQDHIKGLIEKNDWDKVIIFTTEKIASSFSCNKEIIMVVIEEARTTEELIVYMSKLLKENLTGFEVCINLFSGTGKEHMALLASLLNLGQGIRLVKQGKSGVLFL